MVIKITITGDTGENPAGGAGTLVEPEEIRFRTEAGGGNEGIVGVIQEVVQARLPDAACHRRNFRRAKAELGIQRANLVANAQFAEAPEAVTYIAADVDAIDAVVGQRVVLRIDLKRGVAGVGVRREKPAAFRTERPEQFRLDTVGISEQHVGPPFGAEAGYG